MLEKNTNETALVNNSNSDRGCNYLSNRNGYKAVDSRTKETIKDTSPRPDSSRKVFCSISKYNPVNIKTLGLQHSP